MCPKTLRYQSVGHFVFFETIKISSRNSVHTFVILRFTSASGVKTFYTFSKSDRSRLLYSYWFRIKHFQTALILKILQDKVLILDGTHT